MFFTPEATIDARRELMEHLDAGTLTREQAFQRALDLDPFDATALVVLANERTVAGDFTGAAVYAWRAADADPWDYHPWYALLACSKDEDEALVNGILEMALSKSLRSQEGVGEFEVYLRSDPEFAEMPVADAMEGMLDATGQRRMNEPEEVSERLLPHRLIDEVLDADPGLDAELVDSILEHGVQCKPLLVGILRGTGNGTLMADQPNPAVASLALLGEIGDPELLPVMIECATVDDDDLSAAADWGGHRIVSRRPEESLAVLRKMVPGANANERAAIATVLSRVPDMPGRLEALQSLLDGLDTFPMDERSELFMGVAASLIVSFGIRGQELVWSLLRRHQAVLPKRTRKELQDVAEASKAMSAFGPNFGDDPAEATVYDICCRTGEEDGGDFEDDEAGHEPNGDFGPKPPRREARPGRNDPCWCGSGKKYKKCHLEPDENRISSSGPVPAPTPLPVGTNVEEAGLRRRLIDFATRTLQKREMEQAFRTFTGDKPVAGGDDQSTAMESVDWLIHDYVPPRIGRPFIDEFLQRAPGGLNPRQRSVLDAWRRSRYSLFEVLEVRPATGIQVQDLLAGGEFFVYDVNSARRASLSDCFLARVEEFEGRHEFTAVVLTIPEPVLPQLKEWAIDAIERSGLSPDAFLRANSHKLRQEASRLIAQGGGIAKLATPEGDELIFSNARYEILNEDDVRRALDESPVLSVDEYTGDYDWLDAASGEVGGRRVLGHMRLTRDRLTLECHSRTRLERGKQLLRDLAGSALRHKGDDFSGWRSALKNREAAPEA